MSTNYLPKKVYFKTGCTDVAMRELNEIYARKRAFVVSDPDLFESGWVMPVVKKLQDRGIRSCEYFGVDKQLTFGNIRGGIAKLNEFEPDVIVGIGGESVMYAAKIFRLLRELPDADVADIFEGPLNLKPDLDTMLVLVAADFGSGAQNSLYAVAVDDQGTCCVAADIHMLPEISITDADLAKHLKPEEIREQGIRALSLAIRAYAAGEEAVYSTGLLEDSVRLLLADLGTAQHGNPFALEHVMNAGGMSGAAYGNVPFPPMCGKEAYPTAEEAENPAERVGLLAKNLGFESTEAFLAACRALR